MIFLYGVMQVTFIPYLYLQGAGLHTLIIYLRESTT